MFAFDNTVLVLHYIVTMTCVQAVKKFNHTGEHHTNSTTFHVIDVRCESYFLSASSGPLVSNGPDSYTGYCIVIVSQSGQSSVPSVAGLNES